MPSRFGGYKIFRGNPREYVVLASVFVALTGTSMAERRFAQQRRKAAKMVPDRLFYLLGNTVALIGI